MNDMFDFIVKNTKIRFFLNDINSLIHARNTLAEHSMHHISINTKTLTR